MQYCWSQSIPFFYQWNLLMLSLFPYCMAKPWIWHWNMLLQWNGCLQQSMLLLGQWLQAISHPKLFSWANSARLLNYTFCGLTPFLLQGKTSLYWPGLLLLVHFALLLVFAFNPQQDSSITLLAILVGTGILHIGPLSMAMEFTQTGIYIDILESSFALNTWFIGSAASPRTSIIHLFPVHFFPPQPLPLRKATYGMFDLTACMTWWSVHISMV